MWQRFWRPGKRLERLESAATEPERRPDPMREEYERRSRKFVELMNRSGITPVGFYVNTGVLPDPRICAGWVLRDEDYDVTGLFLFADDARTYECSYAQAHRHNGRYESMVTPTTYAKDGWPSPAPESALSGSEGLALLASAALKHGIEWQV